MDLARHIKWIKPPVFLLCLVPAARLAWEGFHDGLGPNPIETITHSTGTWTLTFICVTLTVTPLRKLLHQNVLVRFRRMFGLFAFFYGSLHLMTYVWLDKFFNFQDMIKDVYKRPFITAGFTAYVLMVPLAVTSTSGMIRRLGGRRWRNLHRLIYVTAIAGVVHYYWLVKIDETVPLRFAAVVAILLGYRVVDYALQKKSGTSSRGGPGGGSARGPARGPARGVSSGSDGSTTKETPVPA